ncbi:MAG TPA: hypothetical protein VGR21_01845 [Cryptosporangiaceae bacterium]|nr:hypothetical protein [Cryptosporangiaceae bacterium]
MRRTRLMVAGVALAFVAGCSAGSPATAPSTQASPAEETAGPAPAKEGTRSQPARSPNVIGTYGLGPYVLGAKARSLVRGGKLAPAPSDACGPAYTTRSPYSAQSVEVAVRDGAVAMVSTTSSRYRTPSGVTVGTTEEKLRATYGARLTAFEVPSEIDRVVNYVFTVDGSALGFRTRKSVVTEIFAGDARFVTSYLSPDKTDDC